MRVCVALITVALLLGLACGLPAVAQDQPPASTSETTATDPGSSQGKAKEEKAREEKAKESEPAKPGDSQDVKKQVELEVEVRSEVERRGRYRDRREGGGFLGGVIDSIFGGGRRDRTDRGGGGGGEYGTVSRASHPGQTGPRFSVGMVYAPARGDERQGGVGLTWLNRSNRGLALWLSGRLEQGDDVIEASIPHANYHTDEKRGSYGLQYLHGVGTEAIMLLLGVGFSVDQIIYTDVSNATGWKWDGGSDSKARMAGQVGCRIRVAPRVSLQFGYDTAQSGYLGLAGSF